MPTGDINLSSNFELASQRPLDAKITAIDIAERNAIPLIKRYDMMEVSVAGTVHKKYQLILGTVDSDLSNNLNWVAVEPLLLQAVVDTKGITGFDNNTGITVTYDHTSRTITLSGTLTYYFRGTVHQLTSPWTSPAHTATETTWYLYSSDGVTFSWSTTPWAFTDIMIAAVRYRNTSAQSFALREVHGTMDWNSHDIVHKNIGTYRVSGGSLDGATYTENTASDVATTPGFNTAVIQDEDNITSLPAWTQGTYTTMYIGPSSVPVFDITATFPFTSAGSYLQVNDPIGGTLSPGINNRYYNVYQVLVPVTSDSDSQKYRMIMLQPQATYTSLAAAQAESTSGLNFGNLASTVAEFVIWARITYVTASGDSNTGKCRIATGGVTYVVGSRAGQINVAGFTTNSHSNLAATTLSWLLSGHTGTPDRIPYFDATGAAAEMTTIHGATSKTTPIDADELGIWDSVGNILNKLTWANLKATLASFTQAFTARLASITDLTPELVAENYTNFSPGRGAAIGLKIGLNSPITTTFIGGKVAAINEGAANDGDATLLLQAANNQVLATGLSIFSNLNVKVANGIDALITSKNASDVPSTYPTGMSTMAIGVSQTGWPATYMSVVTFYTETSRICQYAYDVSSPYLSYYRHKTNGSDTWTSWTQISGPIQRVNVTGTASLEASNVDKIIEFNSTSAFNYTIDQMYDGFAADLCNINTGDVTLVAGTGVTLRNISANRKLTSQWQAVSIYFRSATECVIIGNLDA